MISKDKAAFIDPQAVYLKKNKVIPQTGEVQALPTTSRAWPLKSDLIRKYPSQFEPFFHKIFNLSASNIKNGSFQGTVFRFPLRNTQHSDLSSTLYTVDRLKSLCDQFEDEAHLLMLFLKHLHTIEVYEKTRKNQEPFLVKSIRVSNENCQRVLHQRLLFQSSLVKRPHEVHECSYMLETTYTSNLQGNTSHRWLITQYYEGGNELDALENSQFLPLVGVALPLGEAKQVSQGHTFCFLPMPLNDDNLTGLDVHINGYFEVDQSRTHLKWPEHRFWYTADNDWNLSLIGKVLPKAIWKLTIFAISLQKERKLDAAEVYNIMPDSRKVKQNWKTLLDRFWEAFERHECVYTSTKTWKMPQQCYFVADHDVQYLDVIKTVFLLSRVALIDPPRHVSVRVQHLAKQVTRRVLRDLLRQTDMDLSEGQRLKVLEYLEAGDEPELLLGLCLLKLENGKWVKFEQSWNSSNRYLETEVYRRDLLPYTRREFMAAYTFGETGYSILRRVASTGMYLNLYLICH